MRLNVRIRGWQRLYRLLYKVFLLVVVLPNKVVHGIGVRDSTNPDPAGSGGPPPPPHHAHVHPSSSVKGTCTSTSISLTVDFPSHPSTDLYYVAVSTSNSSKPFLLKTVAEYDTPGDMIQLTIEDLLPNRTYWLRVRSHPESEATIAWGPGWRSYGEVFPCRTKPVHPSAASTVKRVGGLSPTSISLEWRPPRRAAAAVHGYRVWYERHQYHWSRGEGRQYHWSEGEEEEVKHTKKGMMMMTRVAAGNTSVVLGGLKSNSAYSIQVESLPSETWSDAVTFRTDAYSGDEKSSRRWQRSYRISEYSFDVDFLANHDSATIDAMPLYLMTCDPGSSKCQPLNTSSYSKDWDRCEEGMAAICPDMRGMGLECLSCATSHNHSVTTACGHWEAKDNFVGYAVHWYCGTGWPESILTRSPITEYCIESTPVPHRLRVDGWASSDGWAQYASCNSDETDPFGNQPRNPMCMCWVWDDRMLSMEPKSRIDKQCGGTTMPFVGELQCNCSSNPERRWSIDGTPSELYVGKSDLYLPYSYYWTPREHYPQKEKTGSNLSTPKKGKCGEKESLGTDGCTWKRHEVARILWWDGLIEAGWNATYDPDTPGHTNHTRGNIAVFKKAVDSLEKHMTPRCCGC